MLHTGWVERYNSDPEAASADRERLSAALVEAMQSGRGHELAPFTGQTAGMIDSVKPAGEIVAQIVAEAEERLR